jgi:MFS family permease
MSDDAARPNTFGPLRLTAGTMTRHVVVYYLAAVASLILFTFAPQAQPFVLTELLGVPEAEQGVLSGNVALFAEIVILASIGAWGVVSDRLGRRIVFGSGLALMGLGLYLTSSVDTVLELYLFRGVFALGAAAATTMLATVVADYVIDQDRGKAVGFGGIGNGLGALITVFVLLRLPAVFVDGGFAPEEAARRTYLIAAAVGIVAAVGLWVGLRSRTEAQREQKKPWTVRTREGFGAARDPGVALAYAAAFVSRGDLAIVGTFFTLWVTTYGTTQAGLSTAEALAAGGLVIGISQGVVLVAAPLFGIMADRLNRVDNVLVALGVSAIGYSSTILVDDPLGGMIYVSAILIGLGEISGLIASGVLIAQQAPRDIRGSVIGVFSFFGAFGVMTATGVGGRLFDLWRPQGPFMLFGIVSLLVLVWGLTVRNKVVPPAEEVDEVAGL